MIRKKRKWYTFFFGGDKGEINPEDIFLDSSNLPNFDRSQFEGKIEKPLSTLVSYLVLVFFFIVIGIFSIKAWNLQVVKGDEYAERSSQNRLRHTYLFSERGSITDRNGVLLASNAPNTDELEKYSLRKYTDLSGFAHLLGYLKYPQKDSSGVFYQKEFVGIDGVEKTYNDYLTGKNGTQIIEIDALGKIESASTIEPPVNGDDLMLSVDSRVQHQLHEYIKDLAIEVGFSGGAGAIMDISSGKLLALTSYPEYDPQVLTDGKDNERIASYSENSSYLNRPVSGLYTPGSVMKLFVAMGVLNEKVIDPFKKILSTGSITVPNPYFPDSPGTTFRDWKRDGFGWIDLREALSYSSNTYFFHVGGGFDGQKGIGISGIEKYVREFGFGSETGIQLPNESVGVVPNPEWKAENFDGDDWRLGDTFLTAIGQYGFQATLLQLLRGTTAIVSNGNLYTPSVVEDSPVKFEKLDFDDLYYKIVRDGMYKAVHEDGTAHNLSSLPVKIGAKTGTAELGVSKEKVNSWITGFFPYDNPKYAFSIMMEKGSSKNVIGALYIASEILTWMDANTPEYTHN